MKYEEVRELTEWLEKSSFTEYSLSIDGVHLSIGKQGAPIAPHSQLEHQQPKVLPSVAVSRAAEEIAPLPIPEVDTQAHIISSPIVGTYYDSPNPESPAFVKVGQRVSKGDTLCILEAMKLMSPVLADVDGVVAEIFVSNEAMVEACMPLFRLEV
ncbi:MAG: acetyl-CoA carboxylase biotin carboxyl carrier protein [Coriobacteriia bacterium]|nr:acetyl-CoA carboxylase biotin carboxyl carrier protein [Coriobacteriia bacterium]